LQPISGHEPLSPNGNRLRPKSAIGIGVEIFIIRMMMRFQDIAARAGLTLLTSAFGAHLFDLQFRNSDHVASDDG
jgi:hypothetical protein